MNKNKQKLKSFTKYCADHPEQRFWQALRNWAASEYNDIQFILVSDKLDMDTGEFRNPEDTFYWE